MISPDGNFIIFASDARLTGDDTNVTDTYVVDVSDPAHPVYKLVSNLADGNRRRRRLQSAARRSAPVACIVAFASNASNFPRTAAPAIFSSPIRPRAAARSSQTASSPAILHASGVIALTGASTDRTGLVISVTDGSGNLVDASLFRASFVGGDLVWNFDQPKTAGPIASLGFGQDFSQRFFVTVTDTAGNRLTTPITVTVHNGVQPTVTPADVAPAAAAFTLPEGQENKPFTITAATLLAHVGDIDTPLSLLHITDVSIRSGGGSLHDNEDGTWTYTPAANFHGAVVFNYTVSDGSKTASSIASLASRRCQ